MTITERVEAWKRAQAVADAAYAAYLQAQGESVSAWGDYVEAVEGPDSENTMSARKNAAAYEDMLRSALNRMSAAAVGGESEAPNIAPG